MTYILLRNLSQPEALLFLQQGVGHFQRSESIPYRERNRLRGSLDSHEFLKVSNDAGTGQETEVPVVRVRLDIETILPAVQGCFAEPGHVGKILPVSSEVPL